ncbi:MAG: universal stress protein [bacterium]
MSIMVPLDTSEVARTALAQAERLARSLDEKLLLVTVADPATVGSVRELARAEGEDPIDVLELNLRSRARGLDVPAEVDLLAGADPAGRLIDRADRPDVSMIVIATHGRTGVSRWRMGSVAERVVRGSTVPVMVIPAPWRRKLVAPPPAQDPGRGGT